MRRLLPLLLLFVPTLAHAVGETLYVNGACANNGNGTAATCAASSGAAGAWLTMNNVACGASTGQLGAGDFLEIKGGTYRNMHWNITSACAGSSGSPIIIQNTSGEDVVFTGETDLKTNTWTSRGAGVYECTNCGVPAGNNVYWQIWYTIGAGSEQRLKLTDQTAASCVSGSVTAGQMEIVAGTGNLCVNIDGSTSPTATNYFRTASQIDFVELFHGGNNWLTFRRNPAGGTFTIWRYRNQVFVAVASASTGIVVDGLHVGWVYDRCLDFGSGGSGASGFIIKNNAVEYCGQEAIRIQGDTAGALIENNTIIETQTTDVFDLCDPSGGLTGDTAGCRKSQDNASAIRYGGNTNNNIIIRGNIIGNTAPTIKRHEAIDLENGCQNVTIEKNYVYGWHAPNSDTGEQDHSAAWRWSGLSNHTWSNCNWRNNRAFDVDNCMLWNGENQSQTGAVVSTVENNTCINPKRNGFYVFRPSWGNAGFTFRNNIIATTTGTPATLLWNISATAGTAFTTAATTFNDFYCVGCSAGTQIVDSKGTTAVATNASVQSAFGASSVYGTPNVNLTDTPPTLKLVSAGGSAFGTGTCTGAPTTDFENDARPLNSTCEIGADEYNAANAGSTSTTVTVTTSTVTTSTTTVVTTSTTTGTGATTTTVPGMFR